MNKIQGIIPAVITPFTGDGAVNYDEFSKLLRFLLQSGVHGAFISGNAGEFYALSLDEKIRLIKAARNTLNGAIPIIFGSGCVTTAETVAATKAAEAEGADVITVITPYLVKPSEDELFAHFEAVCKSTKLPVFLYNNPGVTGVPIPVRVMQRLMQFDNLAGIKDSSGDFALTLDFMQTAGEKLSVYAGRDGLILSTLIHGGAGAVSSVASACPELAVAIYNEYKEGRLQNAVEAQLKLARVRKYFDLGTFPSVVKEVLTIRGFGTGIPRLPVKPLSQENKTVLRNLLAELKLI